MNDQQHKLIAKWRTKQSIIQPGYGYLLACANDLEAALDCDEKTNGITPELVFRALIEELDHPQAYITKDPLSLDSITVDGIISCKSIAEFLNSRRKP